MSENVNRRSNIRIGLDPIKNDTFDIPPSYDYDSKDSFTQVRTGRLGNPYAPDSLMTEQDMALDLESDPNQRVNPSISAWHAAPVSHPPTYRPPPTNNAKGGPIQKSNSNHTIYVPPPLPPATLNSPTRSPTRTTRGLSPYASGAMIGNPPSNPPPPLPLTTPTGNSLTATKKPTTLASKSELNGTNCVDEDDDEPSVLNLDNGLTVDKYTKTTSGAAKDRASVCSFFSTLAVDPEPLPPLPSFMPMLPEPSFASEEFIIPAPVARVVPVSTVRAEASPKLSSQNQKSAYEKKQEEIQVAACFAQDLGFEIVSPMVTPRSKAATPPGQRRI
ncbi:hypothetical protein BGZ80_011366 [Entomortierella chlamydospora]|uniref:Uncharacterized protein n=1 Tax=Entomortierella chlamydospora TaxID=101097 RepID=A0A9P6SZ34_9FUNG|nr:hypothetical protein BGZ80_011366 [Entomortierella chlamydospora]